MHWFPQMIMSPGGAMAEYKEMSINERRKYLRIQQKRYTAADRSMRSQLLDEMEAVTHLDRKSLIRLMASDLERKPRSRQRGRSYGLEVEQAVRVIAKSTDFICAERLTSNLVWLAQLLADHREIATSPALLEKLESISESTLRRILTDARRTQRLLPRPVPHFGNRVLRDIPMRRIPWNEDQPGHFETDLVHHSGPWIEGDFVHTLQLVDVATGWSERVALLGRSYLVMEDAFRRVLRRLPFPVVELHPDNGSEFFNAHLRAFWSEHPEVRLTRSRPYHKNDNRFVEQKNDTLVRHYFGHRRFDTVAQTLAMNQLYDDLWLYYNFFQPVMRTCEKIVVREEGKVVHLKRRFDNAATPLDRLLATGVLALDKAAALLQLRQRTNPLALRERIYQQLDAINAMPEHPWGQIEDVRDTLAPDISA
jgi:hypothetical protein